MTAPSTVLGSIARFVQGFELETLSARTLERLELHLLDTLGALHAGHELPEARAVRGLATASASESSSLLANVATIRATEADDIHLASCTTPGSVVVPTAMSLPLASPRAFLRALAVGYELMIRLGLAIDGPRLLARGVWPTAFGAPLASAAMAACAFELSLEQTQGALATALALTFGTALRPHAPSTSRWLSLGWAAESGVLAAKAAGAGIEGAGDLLERHRFRIAGADVADSALVSGLGDDLRIDELSLKPYPIARQALAAVEACRELSRSGAIEDPATIEEIRIEVPAAQRAVIDHPGVPETRFQSIVSVQYQAALAIVGPPEALSDIARSTLLLDEALTRLMSRIRVEPASSLEPHYPQRWPARVTIRRGGERLERELLSPRGDADTDFGWEDVVTKYRGVPWVAELAPSVRRLHELAMLPRLTYRAS